MRASAGGERSARPGDVHRARVLERLAAGPSRIAAAARRAGTLGRVAAFDEPGWNRTGMHATFGRLDVVGLLGVIADHDDEHHADLEARLG